MSGDLFKTKSRRERYAVRDDLEQVRGIEPPCSAWEADILPLNYTCIENQLLQYNTIAKTLQGERGRKLSPGQRNSSKSEGRIVDSGANIYYNMFNK